MALNRWRRRRLVCLAVTCIAFFTFSLIATNSLSDEGSEQARGPRRSQGAHLERTTSGKGFHIVGANSTGESVVVQLWPKNSLHLVEKAVARSLRLNRVKHPVGTARTPFPNVEKPVPISEDLVPCLQTNHDCQRFREMLRLWPRDKPKAAFYILTQPVRFKYLQNALQSIDRYFNSKFAYPVIIFHESDLIPMIPAIRNITTSELFFQEIAFSIPDFVDQPVEFDIPCMSPIGYRHMCRFHAKGVFQAPIMRGLDYYWRLDDDSILLRDISYDVFRFMRERKIIYGYSWQHLDSHKCTLGLWKATEIFINNTHIKPKFFDEWTDPQIYYNNFEISALSLWLSEEYAAYIEYLDKLGGIYYHRWGDAPIKGLAVSLFVPKKKVYRFKDIGYQHRSYINK